MITNEEKTRLINTAIKYNSNAYAPYSKYKVSASIMTLNGRIYSGCNFECASYGAGVCAERVALGVALAVGERKFKAICVCGNQSTITPCGICRQALIEFGDIDVICCDSKGNSQEYRLTDLLPNAFSSSELN